MPWFVAIASVISGIGSALSAGAKVATSAVTVVVDLLKVVIPPVIAFLKFLLRSSFWVFLVLVGSVPVAFALYHVNILFIFGLSWFLSVKTILILKGMVAGVLAMWVRNIIYS